MRAAAKAGTYCGQGKANSYPERRYPSQVPNCSMVLTE